MNYIAEINSFYDKLETNPLSSSAITLWHALMATANKANWIDKFTVAISVLEVKTGLGKKSVERARNELRQKGYVDWRSRSGNQSAEYQINSLRVKNDPQTVSQSVPKTVSQHVPINKLNYTKENTINIAGEDFFIESKYLPIMNEMLADQLWLEQAICMNLKIPTTSANDYIKKFFVLRTNEGLTEMPILQDCRQHFANWIRIEKGKTEKEQAKQNGYVHPAASYKQRNKKVDDRF